MPLFQTGTKRTGAWRGSAAAGMIMFPISRSVAMRGLSKLFNNARGATAIEYALVASLISVAAILSFENLGSQIDNRYQAVEQKL